MDDWKEVKKQHYGKSRVVRYRNGWIDFDVDGMNEVVGGENLTYDQYLEVQRNSCDDNRQYLSMCYFDNLMCKFKGRVQQIDRKRSKLMFKRLYIDGFYSDGIGFFGKEDHVWMELSDFKEFSVNDCVSFSATIYRYLKTGNGKTISFGLKEPETIEKIESYKVPTDEELINQQINQLICDTCRYYDDCFMGFCTLNEKEKEERFNILKNYQPGKFTYMTVMLAYELEYRMLLQAAPYEEYIKRDDIDSNMKRMIEICEAQPVYYYRDVMESFIRMMNPDKTRLYIVD